MPNKLLFFTDSRGAMGFGNNQPTYPSFIASARTDWTYSYDTVAGRHTNVVATLQAAITATACTHVLIDLCVNDPVSGLGFNADGCVTRLAALRTAAAAMLAAGTGGVFVLTPTPCLKASWAPPLDMEGYRQAVRAGLLVQGWTGLRDVGGLFTAKQWRLASDDLVHPDAIAARRIIANFIAPTLP